MTYARYTLARVPYGSIDVADSVPPGQVLPPPIPGGTSAYYAAYEQGAYPYAMGGYAGARPRQTALSGGVIIVPDPERGVMLITLWWPDASAIHVIRVHTDGTRHPVRGGYALVVAAPTRRNLCPNPSVETGLNGYVPGDGNPVLTRVSAPVDVATVPFGTWALRAVIPGAGALGVTVPTTALGTRPVTIGFAAQLSARPTTMRVHVSWSDAVGGTLTASTVQLTADAINDSVGRWSRHVVSITPPANAVTPTLKVIAEGLPAGAAVHLDAVTVEQAVTDGSFIDGDQLGGTWAGTRGLSESVAAPLMTLADGECPLDVPVSYIVAAPALTGGRVTSGLATLASTGRTWLTHPSRSDRPLTVDLRTVPTLDRGVDQGVFWPLNASRPIVVSAATRQSTTGVIELNALSFAERDELLDVLADVAPVLLRAPADYGYGPGMWLALGALSEDRGNRKPWHDACLVSAPFVEVDPPAVA